MDHYVGLVVDKLREKKLLDKTLIIVAGDHGEALGEKNEVDHGLYIYDVTMRVPFIIYAPAHIPQGLALDAKIRLIDIMPTVCDMFNLPIHDDVQGTTLLPYLEGRETDDLPSYIETYMPREYYGWSELLGLIEGDWKYIKAPKPELYNLTTDPNENNNVYYDQAEKAKELKEKLENVLETYSSTRGASKKRLSPEEQERLRSLGYVAGEFEGDKAKQGLPDPKDKVDVYAIFAHARRYEYQQDYERAERNYKELLRLNPDAPWNYVYLSLLYEKMGKLDNAVQTLEQGRDHLPDSLVILSRLSLFYMKTRRAEDAYQTSQVVLRIDPKYFDALYMSGVALVNMGQWDEARGYFEKALAIEPENKAIKLQYAYSLFALNRGEEALKIYKELEAEYPNDPVVYRELGILYDSMGDLAKAKEYLGKAVELNPSPNTYFNYAVVLERSGELSEAVRYMRMYLDTTREGETQRKSQARQVLAQWERRLQNQ
jgi:tetratricopeptide (TPR) repeat protein